MNLNERIQRVHRGLVQLEQSASVLLLLAVFALMAAQVLFRYVFQAPIAWSEELARLALVWLAFISATFVAAEGRHIAVDIVTGRMSQNSRKLLECLCSVLVVLCCLLLLTGGYRFVLRVGLVASPALSIPVSWLYASAMVGLALIAFHNLLNLLSLFSSGRAIWGEPNPGASPVEVEGTS